MLGTVREGCGVCGGTEEEVIPLAQDLRVGRCSEEMMSVLGFEG